MPNRPAAVRTAKVVGQLVALARIPSQGRLSLSCPVSSLGVCIVTLELVNEVQALLCSDMIGLQTEDSGGNRSADAIALGGQIAFEVLFEAGQQHVLAVELAPRGDAVHLALPIHAAACRRGQRRFQRD